MAGARSPAGNGRVRAKGGGGGGGMSVADAFASYPAPDMAWREALPTEMLTIPHADATREFFYREITSAVAACLAAGHTRVAARCWIPELNPTMDVYSAKTVLTAVRYVATEFSSRGRVKVLVQPSLGKGFWMGMPLSLNGMKRLLETMDWGPGVLGNTVKVGSIDESEVDANDTLYLLIAPQSITGGDVTPRLLAFTEAAEAAGKSVVLFNPKLGDIPSAEGVMGPRGRAERQAFWATFVEAYHFRLFFPSGGFFPIRGCLRRCFPFNYEVNQYQMRGELGRGGAAWKLLSDKFETEPSRVQITKCFTG